MCKKELNDKEYDFQILRLTDNFYEHYPHKLYPEILIKKQRGYNCLLVQSHYDYFICIPYRSDIRHPYAFHFKNTRRSQQHLSGLDYTKAVIIQNPDYISATGALIDKDEYIKTLKFIEQIRDGILEYVDDYVLHMTKVKSLSPAEFRRKYALSTLKYFHKELHIIDEDN